MQRSPSLVFATLLTCASALAAEKGAIAPDEMQGTVKIGDKAPEFTLKDQNGKEHALKDLLDADGYLALVFYRSADWWPYCKRQLVQLHTDKAKLDEAKIKIVGVSYDSIETLKTFSDRVEIDFPLLSDQGSKTIDAFGIRNKEMEGKVYGKNDLTGVPHPGTYLIDEDGVIRAKLFLENYSERHSTDALIEAAKTAKRP